MDGAEDCVVIDHSFAHRGRVLAAYLTGSTDHDLEQTREGLEQKLPNYTISSYLIHLDALPLTLSGEVDRRVLPWPETTA